MNNKVRTNSKSYAMLHNPHLNKGTAFSKDEKRKFNLLGKLPFKVETLDEQVTRAYKQFKSYPDPKQQNLFLNELVNLNHILFYKLVSNHLEEMIPIIYTPQVATACSAYSDEFRRPNGAYIAYPDRNNLTKILDNVLDDEIEIIVITDGERILGIGDQGIGGIDVPRGKLMLYSLFGGIDPKKTLPIVLDVGTNNKKLLRDPMYLGWRHSRITGKNYYNFIDKFITTLKQKLPRILLQWEDFGKANAWQLLDRYREKICSFNDDIQGTATVTLAALLAAIKVTKQKFVNQRIVILGAGSAAIGIVKIIRGYAKHQGISEIKILKNLWLVDCDGLITDQLKNITEIQRPYLRKISEVINWQVKNYKRISFFEVIQNVKPTILIGCSTVPGAFTEKIVTTMTKHVKRPIIFPLSNPTEKCEARPQDLIKWTKGQALIATGSPFPTVHYKNKKFIIAQCNNALVFPGIGLGIIASNACKITDAMFLGAAKVLYKNSPSLKNPHAPLLPAIKDIPVINKKIGKEVAAIAVRNHLSRFRNKNAISGSIAKIIWQPKY